VSNRHRAAAFRNEVLLYLLRCGFSSARQAPQSYGLPLSERLRRNHGDIIGLPWTLGVRNQQTIDLSTAQNEVRMEAANAETPMYASIQARRNHDIEESYVTMPLSVFVKVLSTLHPDLTS